MAMITLMLGSTIKGAHLLPTPPVMPRLDQGTSNACGTTSLAMAMTYLGEPRTHQQIDAEIRRMDIFTSPDQLVRYAVQAGLAAAGYNYGAFEFITAQIDQGHPCICIIDANYQYPNQNSSISGLHYIVVVGYGKDPGSGGDCLVFHDPNIGDDPATKSVGEDLAILLSDFEGMWNGVGWGFHDYFFALAKADSALPPSNDQGVEGTTGVLDGVARLTNGLSQFGKPQGVADWLQGIPNIVGGIVETVIGGVGALIETAGDALKGAVDGVPVLGNLLAPVGDILAGIGAVLGDIANGVGAIVDDLCDAIDDLSNGNIGAAIGDVVQAVGDAAQAVGNAISDAASAVADAVSDFFSGW